MCYIFGFSVKQYSTGKGFSVFTIQNDYLPPTPVSRTQKYGKCVSQSATPHTELNVSLETVNLTHWGPPSCVVCLPRHRVTAATSTPTRRCLQRAKHLEYSSRLRTEIYLKQTTGCHYIYVTATSHKPLENQAS